MRPRVFTDALLYKTKLSLKQELSRFYLHYLWWILEPLLFVVVLYFVFVYLMHRGDSNFFLFLLVGLLHFNWFSKTLVSGSASILRAKHLAKKVVIPKFFFPLEIILKELFKFIITLPLLLAFLLQNQIFPSDTWGYYPLLIAIQLLLTSGLTLLAASLIPFLPDLEKIIATLTRLLFFASGVFWDIQQIIPSKFKALIAFNPIIGMLENYRAILLYNRPPTISDMVYCCTIALASLLIAFSLSHFFHKQYVRKWYQ